MGRVVQRFASTIALIGGFGLTGCELVIPSGQYMGDPPAKGSDGVMTPAFLVDASDAAARTDDASMASNDADRASDVGSATTSDVIDRPDREASVSAGDGARSSEGGARSDASTGTVPRDAAAKDVQTGDVQLPDGATLECHLPCDDTFCCTGQVCCPAVCGLRRCVLALTCPSSANVACE